MAAAKIAISIPAQLLALIEEARQPAGQSRSEFVTHALETYLLESRRRTEAEAYATGYERFPETAEEIRQIDRMGASVLALEPWD